MFESDFLKSFQVLLFLMQSASILSIQSSVVSGRVGNTVAVPIHTLFGHETLCINSVVLAAHPGIINASRFVMPTGQMDCLLRELEKVKSANNIHAIHTGYLGHKRQVNVIRKHVIKHPETPYIYDPVFGDNGSLYIDKELAEESKRQLLPLSTVTTPNVFESSCLSDICVSDIDSAVKASKIIQSKGPKWVLTTGVFSAENEIADILVGPDDINVFRNKRQRAGISGAGDTLAAILTSLLVSGKTQIEAANSACRITQSLIELSQSRQSMPLLTIDLIR